MPASSRPYTRPHERTNHAPARPRAHCRPYERARAASRYLNLTEDALAATVETCREVSCDLGDACQIFQFDEHPLLSKKCWIGAAYDFKPDSLRRYTSRGRNMRLPPTAAHTVSDADGLGLRWEGVGAISGGGATTKLLHDYDPAIAADILDFLFKPNYGLSLQILKVQIGGDTDSSEGAEPSHIHAKGDDNYARGYEWWLMKEAKKRNPDLKLYGAPPMRLSLSPGGHS